MTSTVEATYISDKYEPFIFAGKNCDFSVTTVCFFDCLISFNQSPSLQVLYSCR